MLNHILKLSKTVAMAALCVSGSVWAANNPATTLPQANYFAATQYPDAKPPLNAAGAVNVDAKVSDAIQVPPAPPEAGSIDGIPDEMADLWPRQVMFAPTLHAKSYILIDAITGQILASHQANLRMAPASITKLMLLYLTEQRLASGAITLDDKVEVPAVAQHTGGSRMFLNAGSYVKVSDLIQGVIVESGNDAAVTLANYVAGSQSSLVSLMNATAVQMKMQNTHFTDVMGLPAPAHFSTAYDLSILGRHIIHDFPQYFHWYKQLYFKYNNIRQPNFNRLLFIYPYSTGMKTGSTHTAGYSLVSSAEMPSNPMKLISVVLGDKSLNQVAQESKSLLTYGFRFFKQITLFADHQSLSKQRVWGGEQKEVSVGLAKPVQLNLPTAIDPNQLTTALRYDSNLKAPIHQGQSVGELTISYKKKIIETRPLLAMDTVPEGGFITRLMDTVSLYFHNLFDSYHL